MTRRILVAGIGNIFLRDDGFGVEVVRRLIDCDLPPGTVLRDVGLRCMDLAYELLDDWDLVLVIDAEASGSEPGTLYVVEPEKNGATAPRWQDGHGMDLLTVLATVRSFGALPPPVLLVGCHVADVSGGIGLTPQVEDAVPRATRLVEALVKARFSLATPAASPGSFHEQDARR